MKDPYEVAPGLWIGSKKGDLQRERQMLISRMLEGDEKSKKRILEITNELIEMNMPIPFKGARK